ncbi:MAG: hypothetical protein PHO37_13390 [Kiritimatiellae bacterium]|nr:hypothetical protein [Kiritimatiellia bacterium]
MDKIPFRKVPLRVRLTLVKGVLRRCFLNQCRKKYVRQHLASRQGECRRCSVCCQLSAPCPALQWSDPKCVECKLYKYYRLPNCCTFPIDERDLADRDLLAPDTKCGYHW